MKAPPTSSATWAERYESLRRYVLEGRQRLQTHPLGMALWVSKGMAGWIRQWSQLTAGAAPSGPAALPGGLVQGQHQQLTLLLAQMTLEHLQVHAAV